MRSSVLLLLCALAGVLGGGALIGLPALGACLIFDSLAIGAYGLMTHEWGTPPTPIEVPDEEPTVYSILQRAARAS